MKISELMERLGELQGQYGDLEVETFEDGACRTSFMTSEINFIATRVSCIPYKIILHLEPCRRIKA